MTALTPNSRKIERPPRPVDAIVERVRRSVLDGEYRAGETLPPERELAVTLGVSRLTLRAALGRLETEGLVRARQGDGVRVLDLHEDATLAVLPYIDATRRDELFRSFLELRRALACEAVALACERASDADLDELEARAERQRTETDDGRYVEGDLAFSRRVLVAADNLAMVLLFNTLVPVYEAHPELGRAITKDRETSLAGYALVLGLLRNRDPEGARRSLAAMLALADERALAELPRTRTKKTSPKSTENPGSRRP